ncbi:hypothetical protein XENTR_v10017279 [Xenopus tropicalis]|nr:hypothetical protein XENTR_v10017279 [Xenopus tropicalis]
MKPQAALDPTVFSRLSIFLSVIKPWITSEVFKTKHELSNAVLALDFKNFPVDIWTIFGNISLGNLTLGDISLVFS